MSHDEHKPLKLIAKDLEDLKIFAAHLQDAIVSLTATSYKQKEKTLNLLTNRFCWEKDPVDHDGKPHYHRTHAHLSFHHVNKVQHKGFDQHGGKRSLNLLTIEADHPQGSGPGHAILHFSGGEALKVDFDDLHCLLGDLDAPWVTPHKPTHLHEHVAHLKKTSSSSPKA